MDAKGAIEELERMQRELRRMKFQTTDRERRLVVMLERMVQSLLKRFKAAQPKGSGNG